MRLNKGLGISLVDRTPEELVYIMFHDVVFEYVQENDEHSLRADVYLLQVSSMLLVHSMCHNVQCINLALYACVLYSLSK